MAATDSAAASGRARRTKPATNPAKRKMIIAIRAACARLGLDDDHRRDLQQGLTGKSSMADMNLSELGRVLDRLNRDWKGPMGHRPHVGKIKALWHCLYWLGEVERDSEQALSAFVRRQTGVSSIRFLDHRKAFGVIEALKAWLERAGVSWPKDGGGHTEGDRFAVVVALGAKVMSAGLVDGPYWQFVAAQLGVSRSPLDMTGQELDQAIRCLGGLLRAGRG